MLDAGRERPAIGRQQGWGQAVGLGYVDAWAEAVVIAPTPIDQLPVDVIEKEEAL